MIKYPKYKMKKWRLTVIWSHKMEVKDKNIISLGSNEAEVVLNLESTITRLVFTHRNKKKLHIRYHIVG